MKASALPVLDPALVSARGVEAREIGNEQGAIRFHDAGHLCDGRLDVRDVDERQVAHDEVERRGGKWQSFGLSFEVNTPLVASASRSDQGYRRIHAHDINAVSRENSAKP